MAAHAAEHSTYTRVHDNEHYTYRGRGGFAHGGVLHKLNFHSKVNTQ